jgi:hypothetical protein
MHHANGPVEGSPRGRSDFAWHAVGRRKSHHHAMHRDVQIWFCPPDPDTAAAAAGKLGARTDVSAGRRGPSPRDILEVAGLRA